MAKYQSTKLFDNYSVALRQWKAAHSHCELLHGYALKFKVWFESVEPLEEDQLDEMNWIMDYGGFKASPASGWYFADLIANDRPHEIIENHDLKRFEKGINLDERGAGPDPKLHG